MAIIKNIEHDLPLALDSLVVYNEGQIVSRTLAQNSAVSFTLFAFDKGEEISSHHSRGDAMVTILDGSAQITVGDTVHTVNKGQTLVMPANVPHALLAVTPFKMSLCVIFPPKSQA